MLFDLFDSKRGPLHTSNRLGGNVRTLVASLINYGSQKKHIIHIMAKLAR
jgi:hypothetical protein